MNNSVTTGSPESQKSHIADFLTAFNLSFYTQLAEVVNNPKSQIYRIGLWTSATARCLLQISELTGSSNEIRQEHRSFSILMHIRLDDALAAKSLCEMIATEFLETSYKSTIYGIESTKTLPKWVREVVTKYPIALRINGLVPQESAQEVLYSILEAIALQWVELGNLAREARGFLGNDRKNHSKKPEWKILMPGLTHFGVKGRVTEDIAATLEDNAYPLSRRRVWQNENEQTTPLSKNAARKRARYQSSIVKKYYAIMDRVQGAVRGLSWAGFDADSSEIDRLSQLQALSEEFIPPSVTQTILSGVSGDCYALETGNVGIWSINMTLLDLQKDFGQTIMLWEKREIQFSCEVNITDRDKLELAWSLIAQSDVGISWTLEIKITSDPKMNSGATIEKIPGFEISMSDKEALKAYITITTSLGRQDTFTFKKTINLIILALHEAGFPLSDEGSGSHLFGFLKLGANENGWIQGQVQRDRHQFNKQLAEQGEDARDNY